MNRSLFRLDLEPLRVFSSTPAPGQMKLTSTSDSATHDGLRTQMTSSLSTHVPNSESTSVKGMFDAQDPLKQLVLPDLTPISDIDILVGRHKKAVNHIGNRRFRCIISSFLPKYFEKECRTRRSRLALQIIESIQQSGGRFLKQSPHDCGHWVELGEKEKRNKVAHSLRDAAKAARSKDKPTMNKGTLENPRKHLSIEPTSVNKEEERLSCSSPFEDHSIGVDFPVDLDLLLLLP